MISARPARCASCPGCGASSRRGDGLFPDEIVGRLWRRIERQGGTEDTLAVFLSDNGFYWGEHGLIGKFLPYLDALRVPMYMRWDGVIEPGSVDRRLTLNIDLAPTIFAATGIGAAYQPDGRSLLDSSWHRRWAMFDGPTDSASGRLPRWSRGYFDGRHHFFRWKDGFRELYDTRRDPFQLENLLSPGQRAGREVRLRAERFERRLRGAANCAGPRECP